MLNSVNICSLHKDRKEILKKTLDICFPNQQKFEIKSIDTHENGSIVSLSTTKKISDTSGAFEETLVLTKGCRIILIKNINIDLKISNGLEGEYVDHSDHILLMRLVDGSITPIPKIKMKIEKLERHGTFVYRTQFPTLLSYSVTIHRVQGATLNKIHVYLDNTIFCDGQAYVALSRVKDAESVHILNFDTCAFKTNFEIVHLLDYAKKNKTMKNYTSSVDFDNVNDNSIEILNENDNKKVYNSIRKIRLKKF